MIIDDEKMIYDWDNHMYILNKEYFASQYGIDLNDALNSDGDLNPDTIGDRFLKRVSLVLYEFMWSYHQDTTEAMFVLSKERNRNDIQQALCEFAYSLLVNNTDKSIYFDKFNYQVPQGVYLILQKHDCLCRGKYFGIPDNLEEKLGKEF